MESSGTRHLQSPYINSCIANDILQKSGGGLNANRKGKVTQMNLQYLEAMKNSGLFKKEESKSQTEEINSIAIQQRRAQQ